MDLNRNTQRLHGADRETFTIFLFLLYFLLVHLVALHQIAFSTGCTLLTSLLVKVRFRVICHNIKLVYSNIYIYIYIYPIRCNVTQFIQSGNCSTYHKNEAESQSEHN